MAERAAGLPDGVLRAIGIVESGRRDARLGRVAPWPWTIDLAGRPFFFDAAAQAVAAADASRAGGALTADIGCFQISMLYHPSVFPDIQTAFNPAENARVAAGLLAGLRDRTGSWPAAIAAYHSADPDRGAAYAVRVLNAWGAHSELPPGDVVVAGVRVITPGLPGTAPGVLVLAPGGALPRVFAGLPVMVR